MICFSQEAPTVRVSYVDIHCSCCHYRWFTWCFLQDIPTIRVKSDILYVCTFVYVLLFALQVICIFLITRSQQVKWIFIICVVFYVVSPFRKLADLRLTFSAYIELIKNLYLVWFMYCTILQDATGWGM